MPEETRSGPRDTILAALRNKSKSSLSSSFGRNRHGINDGEVGRGGSGQGYKDLVTPMFQLEDTPNLWETAPMCMQPPCGHHTDKTQGYVPCRSLATGEPGRNSFAAE